MLNNTKKLTINIEVFFATSFCAFIILTRMFSPDLSNSTLWDVGIILDGAWRLSVGQLPHVDYSSPFGPVTFFFVELGNRLASDPVAGLAIGVAIASGALLILWLAAAFFFEDSRLFTLLLVLSVSFMVTPRVIGYPDTIGFVGLYVTFGYGMLIYLLCDIFQGRNGNRAMFGRGALFGIVSVLCAFTKITFGGAAFILFVYAAISGNHGRNWLYGVIVGGLFALIGSLIVYEGRVLAVLADLVHTAEVKAGPPLYAGQFDFPHSPILIFVEIWLLYGVYWAIRNGALPIALVIISIGILLTFSSSQPAEIVPLAALSALFVVKDAKVSRGWLRTAFLSVPLVLTVGLNLAAIGVSPFLVAISDFSPFARTYLAEKNVRSRLLAYGDTGQVLAYLETMATPETKVSVMSTNAISSLLRLSPTYGGRLYWHEGVTFGKDELDNNEILLEGVGDATVVLVPTAYEHVPRSLIDAVRRAFDHCSTKRAASWQIFDCRGANLATSPEPSIKPNAPATSKTLDTLPSKNDPLQWEFRKGTERPPISYPRLEFSALPHYDRKIVSFAL